MTPAAKQEARWSRDWIMGLLLLAGVLLAYQPAWHAGFIWDDDVYITTNPLLTAPDGLWRIWFSFDSPSQYFPLVYSTLRLEHALWGLAPSGYHLVNIALHGVNAVLLWRLLLRLEIPGAWLGAAIFALHPVQVESVAWVTELKNVQMGFFFFLALLAWTEFLRGKNGRAWRFYTLSLAFYALALFSKTTACTLPAVLLLICWLRGERIGWRRLLEAVPYLAMGVGMGLLTIYWERYHQGTQGTLFTMSMTERVLIAARGVWFYLDKLFWPAKLTFSYPRWSLPPSKPLSWLWLIALCGVAAVAYFARRRIGRGPFAALAFFVATLAPVLGLIMLYTFRYTFVADHYQYLACIGPIALVSAGIETLRERAGTSPRLVAPGLCAVLICGLGLLTWLQSGTYRDGETLWNATIARNPRSWMGYANLGNWLLKHGHIEEGVTQIKNSLRLNPDVEEDHFDYGAALIRTGRTKEAVAEFNRALEINPHYPEAHNSLGFVLLREGRTDEAIAEIREALRFNPTFAEAYYNLGNALLAKGRTDEAIAQYRQALRLNPDYPQVLNNLGNALLGEGRTQEAIDDLREAVRADPNYTDAYYNLGNVLFQMGQIDDAMAQYRAALKIDPTYAKAHGNLGLGFYLQGRLDEAVAEFRQAVQLDPNYAEAHCNMAIALARQGRADEAIAEFRKTLQIRPSSVDAHYNLGNVLLRSGQDSEAIAQMQAALALQPASTAIQDALAWMLATVPEISLRNGAAAVQLAMQATRTTGGGNPEILRTLAAASAQAGQFSNAVQIAQQALRLAQAQSNSTIASALPREIALYQSGRPYEEAH